jgi:hypothetical protein
MRKAMKGERVENGREKKKTWDENNGWGIELERITKTVHRLNSKA